jgi:hypothetical protein
LKEAFVKKKILFLSLTVLIIFAFISCSNDSATTMTVTNNTSFDLDFVCWYSNDSGNWYYFGGDQVYDYVLGYSVNGLHPGSSDTQDVAPGNSPVYFWFAVGGPEYRTVTLFQVNEGENSTCVLTDYTQVVKANFEEPVQLSEIVESPKLLFNKDHQRKAN